jgi:hypothetical protein
MTRRGGSGLSWGGAVSHLRLWLENALGRRAPHLYRAARATSRLLRQWLGRPGYADARSDFNYYREVIRLAGENVPGGGAVIDVGSGDTTVIDALPSFAVRMTLDRRYIPPRPGIEHVTSDFLAWHQTRHFDLVLCLQVLEHLDDPGPFARRLFDLGATVIISVPYRWPAGLHQGHVQDPVDERSLESWTGRRPIETLVVRDGQERLIAIYRDAGL